MSLICPICGIPVVPFGGEEVCLSRDHADGYGDDELDPPEDIDGDEYYENGTDHEPLTVKLPEALR